MRTGVSAMAGALALVHVAAIPASAQPADGQRTGARAVSLEALLEHAREHSPRLARARARARDWRVDAAASDVPVPADPEVQVGVGPRLRGDASDVDVQVQLRQRLEIAGEPIVRGQVADRARARADAELDAAWFELHHAIHSTYHRALIDRGRVDVATRMVAFSERLVAVARRRVELGEDAPLALQLAQLEHVRARQRLLHERHRYFDARLTLSELSGWPADPPPVPAGELDAPRRAPSVDALVALARRRGPQLAVLRAAAAEAEARADLAHRDGWPEPAIGLNYQLESEPGDATQREHQILGVLSIPLPFFQRNPVGRAAAEVDLDIARADHDAALATLRVRMRRLASTVNAAAAQLELYRAELVPLTAERLEQLERAYRIGEIGLLEVAAARDRLLAAELEALAAYEEYFAAVTALVDAIGAEPWADEHHDDEGHR